MKARWIASLSTMVLTVALGSTAAWHTATAQKLPARPAPEACQCSQSTSAISSGATPDVSLVHISHCLCGVMECVVTATVFKSTGENALVCR